MARLTMPSLKMNNEDYCPGLRELLADLDRGRDGPDSPDRRRVWGAATVGRSLQRERRDHPVPATAFVRET
jgi:hypothetical protein